MPFLQESSQYLLEHISITQRIHSSDSSEIFLVKHRGTKYCLKVFHVNEDPGFTAKGRDLCRHRCEVEAYKLLSTAGVCEQGFVPKFYALYDDVDPLTFRPHLDSFFHDFHHPCAILLEYLPGAQRLNCVNYSPDRINKAISGIQAVHSAHIVHNDPYPKNILIVPGATVAGADDRVVWIDFDIAINFGSKKSGAFLKYDESKETAFEKRLVEGFGMKLAEDWKEGLPPNTKYY